MSAHSKTLTRIIGVNDTLRGIARRLRHPGWQSLQGKAYWQSVKDDALEAASELQIVATFADAQVKLSKD